MSNDSFIDSGVTGEVVHFKKKGGFGFITYDDAKVFFHISEVSYSSVEVGDEVTFDLYMGSKGYIAKSVQFSTWDDDNNESESESGEELIQQGEYGVVNQYNDKRSFGFIRVNDTYNKVFFHISDVPEKNIEVGDEVRFDLFVGPKGYYAESIEVLNDVDNDEDNDDNDSESESDEAPIHEEVAGVVKQYNDKRRFGFIWVNDTYNKVFFHISAVPEKYIEVGDEVRFDLFVGPKGYYAESIEVLNLDGEDSDSEPDEAVNQEALLNCNATGVVTRYLNRRRFGFIKVNETYSKVFFHVSEVSFKPVAVQDQVEFHLYVGPKGYFAKCINFVSPVVEDNDWNETHFGRTSGSHGAKDGSNPAKASHDTEKSPGGETAHEQQRKGADQTSNQDTSRMSREKGNTFFKLARDQGSDKAKLDRFKSALECYKKAYASSQKDDDLVSAAKNTGTVYWKLAKLKMNTCPDERKVIHAHFKEALQHFGTAYTKRNCMVEEWGKHLERSIKECLDDIRTWIAPRNDEDRITALKEYVGYMPECDAKVSCYIRIANMYFRKGKDALQHQAYKSCQGYMDECSTTLNEAKKRCTGADSSFKVNVTDLEEDVQYQKDVVQKCLSKAKDEQARREQEQKEAKEKEIAKEQLKGVLKKLESLKKLPVDKFVERVYKQWPPKGIDESKIPSASSSSSSS
ncbi:uncharacterized protein LOC115918514 [Strongylocentrotus purpuratus]|uniref:CSD domain-containing protein n=1 Tax=Strongylocentrotus purpuratus TaxID=7668 RepID=A0A7M7NIS9_STRPU|nr:uncharacterized protein LOC115918514 [Strongylocentrotus purpuratus]|eukprot:XP_003729754.1 PREDICTED: uncharacterized protein LOC100893638 [Strongylocentrotus purpuratus]